MNEKIIEITNKEVDNFIISLTKRIAKVIVNNTHEEIKKKLTLSESVENIVNTCKQNYKCQTCDFCGDNGCLFSRPPEYWDKDIIKSIISK